jgi:hypothetical protein
VYGGDRFRKIKIMKKLDTKNIIDNSLESFPFFPIRFVFFLIACGSLFYTGFSIIEIRLFEALVGLLFFILTFAVTIVQKRITINMTEMKYREYYNFFGLKNGKWESFKGFTVITITRSTQAKRLGSKFGVNSIEVANDEFYLNLKKDNYNKLNIAAGDYDSMLNKAITLAHQYQLGIIDCRYKPIKKYTYEEVVENFPKKTY